MIKRLSIELIAQNLYEKSPLKLHIDKKRYIFKNGECRNSRCQHQ